MPDKGSAWTCNQHGTTQPDGKTYCPQCMGSFRTRKAIVDMTIDERVEELGRLSGQLTIPFSDMHQRIEELMGRGVWTHEMADFDSLVKELRNGDRVKMADIIAKLPQDKPVILIEVPQ